MITLTEIKNKKRIALDNTTLTEKTKTYRLEIIIDLFLNEIGFESEIRANSNRPGYVEVYTHKKINYLEIIGDAENHSLMLVNTSTKDSYTIQYSKMDFDEYDKLYLKEVFRPFFVKGIGYFTFEEGFNYILTTIRTLWEMK